MTDSTLSEKNAPAQTLIEDIRNLFSRYNQKAKISLHYKEGKITDLIKVSMTYQGEDIAVINTSVNRSGEVLGNCRGKISGVFSVSTAENALKEINSFLRKGRNEINGYKPRPFALQKN